jgi:hypothetical protein
LSLFTVAALDHPFKGDVRIHPAAFEQVLERGSTRASSATSEI